MPERTSASSVVGRRAEPPITHTVIILQACNIIPGPLYRANYEEMLPTDRIRRKDGDKATSEVNRGVKT